MNATHFKAAAGMVLAGMLAGCAMSPTAVGIDAQQRQAMHANGVRIGKALDDDMTEATRTKSALRTAGKILAMFAGTRQSFGGDDEERATVDLKGYGAGVGGSDVATLDGPADASVIVLEALLGTAHVPINAESAYRVSAHASDWGLRYTEMDSDKYRFFYTVEFDLRKGDTLLRKFVCHGEAKQELTLDAWKADHGVELHRVEARAGGKCARGALVAFGLADYDILRPGSLAGGDDIAVIGDLSS